MTDNCQYCSFTLRSPTGISFTPAHHALINLRLDELAIELKKLDLELDVDDLCNVESLAEGICYP